MIASTILAIPLWGWSVMVIVRLLLIYLEENVLGPLS